MRTLVGARNSQIQNLGIFEKSHPVTEKATNNDLNFGAEQKHPDPLRVDNVLYKKTTQSFLNLLGKKPLQIHERNKKKL